VVGSIGHKYLTEAGASLRIPAYTSGQAGLNCAIVPRLRRQRGQAGSSLLHNPGEITDLLPFHFIS
jgi:hypothetical protein